MSYNFTLQAVDLCLPISRKELLLDVVVARLYGDITDVWHHPGHIFISTDKGMKLFTFDCNPIHPQNGFSNSSLDIHNSPSSIVDIILISPSLAVVVEMNGHCQWWRYTSDCDWVHIGNVELCHEVHTRVFAVAFLSGPSTLVWCEGREKHGHVSHESTLPGSDKSKLMFCIKSKSFSVSDLTAQTLREQEIQHEVVVMENCPACYVFPLADDKIFIRTKVEKDQLTISLVCSPDLNDVTMFVGQERLDVDTSSTVGSSLDFRSILLKHLPTIIKMELNYGDLGTKQNKDRIVALSSCGLLEIFTITGCDKKKLTNRIVPVSLEDSSSIQAQSWFVHKKFVGIICNGKVSLFSLEDGTCTSRSTSDDMPNDTRVFSSASPAFLAWTLKPNGLMALQATDPKAKTVYTSPNNLPDDALLETAVLQLTHLHQLKQSGYDKDVSDKLDRLRQAWREGRGSHQSQIVDMIAPLVDEYWRLEDASKVLLDKQEHQATDVTADKMVDNRFTEEISKTCGLPRRAKESRLLWLAQEYPHLLLDNLTQGITLDCDEVVENELPRWQSLLGIEGWDLSRFELVCRLLHQHHPQKLCHFVKCAESVSEQTVGVSAFVRKKHSLIFYRSALECLPLAETSCDPSVAAAAHGKLILAGGGNDSVEKALKHLLGHSLWREAVDLVKGHKSDRDRLPSYLYITVTALAQSRSLSEFIPEILDLMPSWKSFLFLSHVTSRQPEIRQRQLSTSASDLFCCCDDPSDVSIGDVKPYLMELIKKMDGKQ